MKLPDRTGQDTVVLSPRFAQAVAYAAHWHDGQVRKGTTIPYICHPLAVAASILEAGGDEDVAIAGLLHDVAEDCGGEARLIEIRAEFGDRVERIVRACSDSLAPDPRTKAPWRERKERHLEELRTADSDVIIVTAADKLGNARALVTDLRVHGIDAMGRFNAPPDEIAWYYGSVSRILEERSAPPVLMVPLLSAVNDLTTMIETDESGRH